MPLLIYSPQVTPRIKYIFNFIFREILICDFELTSIAADFIKSNSPKISYHDHPLDEELFFCNAPLLTKHSIKPIEITFTTFGDQKVPFAVEKGALPFDLFAASFYFLSRYEEYLPFKADEHGRFPAEKSLQYQLDLLKTPIIDEWSLILKNILKKKFPSLLFGKRKFQHIPTINIARAYHFRSSGFIKNTSRILKAAVHLNAEKMITILKTGLGQKDPFDTYAYLTEIHHRNKLKPIYFFLLSKQGATEFDQNIQPEDKNFSALITKVAQEVQIGLHPSYASNVQTNKISEELSTLQEITHQRIDSSRQHFLKIHLPHTYLQLIKVGINHDYSMGYSSQIGLRAGTCTPFFWYDLQLEKQSHLRIHPFAIMDVTLQHHLKLKPQEAKIKIEELKSRIKFVDGTFYSLWHNESLSETGKWKGWKAVYEFMLKDAID